MRDRITGGGRARGRPVVVLTALEVEHAAAAALLVDPVVERHAAGTLFEVGTLRGGSTTVVLATMPPGNITAATVTERAIAHFAPRAVLFVGVAGALHDDLDLGDVVVATYVYAYHGGKEEGGEFLARPRTWPASHELDQLARIVTRASPRSDSHDATVIGYRVYFRPIAAGEVVVDSQHGHSARRIRQYYNDAAAVEMEGAGTAAAAQLNADTPMLVVRGISDFADGTKERADRDGSQILAATNAAGVAFAVINALPPVDGSREPVTDEPTASQRRAFAYISYAPSAREYVRRLVGDLAARRVATWFDVERVAHGGSPAEREEWIDACSAMIVVMAGPPDDAGVMVGEIKRARSLGKPLFPLLLDGEPLPDLRDVGYADVDGDRPPSAATLREIRRAVMGSRRRWVRRVTGSACVVSFVAVAAVASPALIRVLSDPTCGGLPTSIDSVSTNGDGHTGSNPTIVVTVCRPVASGRHYWIIDLATLDAWHFNVKASFDKSGPVSIYHPPGTIKNSSRYYVVFDVPPSAETMMRLALEQDDPINRPTGTLDASNKWHATL